MIQLIFKHDIIIIIIIVSYSVNQPFIFKKLDFLGDMWQPIHIYDMNRIDNTSFLNYFFLLKLSLELSVSSILTCNDS